MIKIPKMACADFTIHRLKETELLMTTKAEQPMLCKWLTPHVITSEAVVLSASELCTGPFGSWLHSIVLNFVLLGIHAFKYHYREEAIGDSFMAHQFTLVQSYTSKIGLID